MACKLIIGGLAVLAVASVATAPATAQNAPTYGQAIGAAIASDISKDRQADREARQFPYASADYGSIRNAAQARDACGAEALNEAGRDSKLVGRPIAATMSTGWEVEGHVRPGDHDEAIPFVCSVRNGSVSGILLK